MSKLQPQPAFATIAVWRNEEQFKVWLAASDNVDRENTGEIRIIGVPLQLLVGDVSLPPGVSPEELALLGIAYGEAEDNSDIRLMHHRLLRRSDTSTAATP